VEISDGAVITACSSEWPLNPFTNPFIIICKPISANVRLIMTCPLQVISLEGWTDIMYYVQDAHSFWDWIYFVLLIVVSATAKCYYRIS
jgi:hypothetical protein